MPRAKAWTPASYAWGDPDLQGVYTFSTNTPLERPDALANKDSFTEAELAKLEEQAEAAREADVIRGRAGVTLTAQASNAFWTAAARKGRLTGRTSLIVDPENGRMPPFTARAQKIRAERQAEEAARRVGTPPFKHRFTIPGRTIRRLRVASLARCHGSGNPITTELRFCKLLGLS